jgi:DNA-binding CsgD family transcriptional regulator
MIWNVVASLYRFGGNSMPRQSSGAAMDAPKDILSYQGRILSVIARSNPTLGSSLPHTVQQSSGQPNHLESLTATIFERLDCAYLVVDQYQKIVEANAAAQRMLDQAVGLAADECRRYQFIRETINRCGIGLKFGALVWIATSGNRGIVTPLAQIEEFTADQTATILLIDLDVFSAPNPTTLKRLFGLTFAECRLAFHLAQGRTPQEVARLLGVSRATVGSQLGALFSKTHTKRQAELVALLGRIALLP